MHRIIASLVLLITASNSCLAQRAGKKQPAALNVIGYYAGRGGQSDSFDMRKLTHVIFSFCHLNGNRLHVANRPDTMTINKLVVAP